MGADIKFGSWNVRGIHQQETQPKACHTYLCILIHKSLPFKMLEDGTLLLKVFNLVRALL